MSNTAESQAAETTTIFQGGNSGFQVGNNYGQITVQTNSLLSSNSTAHSTPISAALGEFYLGAKRLDIQRISGDRLPMEQCYINLAIVNYSLSAKIHTNQLSSPFSLFNRLKIETVDKGTQVTLKTIFDQKQLGNKVIKPKRILIHGHAGVGKTTLCKKIVYEFLNHRMWNDLFDLLLWVPLRKLKWKSSSTRYHMEDLFYDEYFSQHPDGHDLARAMWISINESPTREKTLFLLDGLDEVYGQWGLGTPMNEFLGYLLRQPQVIITSRPQTLNRNELEPLDLELETVGFLPEQVIGYINMVHKDKEPIAKQIQEFIHSHWLIQGLVRIPIQLDALCYSWNRNFQSNSTPKNITTLYQAINIKLWKKDICRLDKSYGGRLLTEVEASNLRTNSQIEALVLDEINLLEGLAFSGLYNNITDFNEDYRDKIIENLLPSGRILFSDSLLAKLSFLRTSDSTLQDKEKSYHFLHLTFQEFFAASYFVRQWISGQLLLCLVIDGNHNAIHPYRFLQKEKYNARYDIFWRFVAGLLQSHQPEKPLLQFFQMLDDKPRDLLGPTHQRLLMHCFNEVPSKPCFENLRTRVNAQLKQWALFEHKLQKEMKLCREMEFPDNILCTMIDGESKDVKKAILEALKYRPQLSSQLLDLVASLLGSTSECDMQGAAIRVLGNHTLLPENILQALVLRLEHPDWDIRYVIINAFRKHTALPENILRALVSRLEHSNSDVQLAAIRILGNHTLVPENILQALVSRLEHLDFHVLHDAIDALGEHIPLPENILQALVLRLEDSEHVWWEAIQILDKHTALPENILQALVPRLGHSEWIMREGAINVFSKQTTLPENILQALVSQLEHSDWHVLHGAINALVKHIPFPKIILQALVSRLEHSDWYMRGPAINALGEYTALQENVLQALVFRLEDSNLDMRQVAADILNKIAPLPKNILQALALKLEDSNPFVRRAAIEALGRHIPLPEDILQALVSRLEDSELDVDDAAMTILDEHIPLPDNILQTGVLRLEDSDNFVRQSAFPILDRYIVLPENILQALVSRLEDSDEYVRKNAIDTLCSHAALSENILQALVFVLSKNAVDISSGIRGAFLKQDNLYEDFLNFDTKTLRLLYKLLLQESFSGQLSCHMQDGTVYIDIPDRPKEILLGLNKDAFLEAFRNEASALGRPISPTDDLILWQHDGS